MPDTELSILSGRIMWDICYWKRLKNISNVFPQIPILLHNSTLIPTLPAQQYWDLNSGP
jgi:hypothetical protein